MERIGKFLDRWGYYILAVFCVAAILLSALWTNQQRAAEKPETQVLADESQRLEEAQQASSGLRRPVAGEVIRPFSPQPLYFEALNLWKPHLGLDFAAEAGEKVYAMAAGTIVMAGDYLEVLHEDGRKSIYRGLAEISVQAGATVKQGDVLGSAGGRVPFEGEGAYICVQLLAEEEMIDFGQELIDKNAK